MAAFAHIAQPVAYKLLRQTSTGDFMGKLNDYGNPQPVPKSRFKSHFFWRGIFLRIGLASLLFIGLVELTGGGGQLGQYADFIAERGLTTANSWVDFGKVLPVSSTASQGQSDNHRFILPVDGVIMRDFSLTDSSDGVLIKTEANTQVKAAAEGTVIGCAKGDDGLYHLELTHADGYRSVYYKLADTQLVLGQTVGQGELIGTTSEQNLQFAIWYNGEQQDTLLLLLEQKND